MKFKIKQSSKQFDKEKTYNNKNVLKAVVMTSLIWFLVSGIGVMALTLYADDIIYNPANTNWKIDNAESALNDLYTMTSTKLTENYTNGYNAGVAATKKGNATAAQVLAGRTFTNSSGVNLTGTMTNRGAWTSTPTGSGNVTIPAGYHNGSGYVNTATVYSNGYNKGVTDADGRANASSTNYKTGYNNGYNAGVAAGKPTKTQTGSTGCGAEKYSYVNCSITFSDLTEVAGIKSINLSGDVSMIITSATFSGNVVTLRAYNGRGWGTSDTFTVTALGY